MKCKDAKPLLSLFLDGMLSGSEMRELSGHFESVRRLQERVTVVVADAKIGSRRWHGSSRRQNWH